MCCVCRTNAVWNYGRCTACFKAMDPILFARLKNMTRAERKIEFETITGIPETPKWTYEGREDELIAALDAEEKTK